MRGRHTVCGSSPGFDRLNVECEDLNPNPLIVPVTRWTTNLE